MLLPDVTQMYLPPLSRKILEKLVISNPLRVQRLKKEVQRRRSLIADRASMRYSKPSEPDRGSLRSSAAVSEAVWRASASAAEDTHGERESEAVAEDPEAEAMAAAAARARLMRRVTRGQLPNELEATPTSSTKCESNGSSMSSVI